MQLAKRKALGAIVLALGCFGAMPIARAGTYVDLGNGIVATGASADGAIVAGYSVGGSNFFMWTSASGLQSIGGHWNAGFASVSWDGASIGGSAAGANGNYQAAVYDVAAAAWTTLGGIGGVSAGVESSGWGLSGDGSTLVGLGWINAGTAHAVRSDGHGGLSDLGTLGGSSRANGANADGSVIVGWQEQSDGYWQGTYWVDGVATLMVDASGNRMSAANAVSADGTWIIGDAAPGVQPWRFNTLTGAVESLGDLVPYTFIQGSTGISADGSVIVGYDRDFGPPTFGQGSIWIEGLGMQNLTSYATGLGIDLQGHTLALPMGISADGKTVFGLNESYAGFVVTLTPVPEAGSGAMFALGLFALWRSARRVRSGVACSPRPRRAGIKRAAL